MITCKECVGDGIVWVSDERMHPLTNISNRHWRANDGRRGRFYGDGTSMLMLDGLEWSFNCPRCSGRGLIEWTRGRSLTPTLPQRSPYNG